MGITVRILIHELELRFGEVLAGAVRLRRQCSDVRLLTEAPCDPDFLYVADATSAKALVEAAAVDAVVLEVGSDAAVGKERLVLRGCGSVVEAFTFLQEVFGHYRSWLEDMDRSLIRNEGLQGLFDVSEGFLLNNTVVVDPALKLLAYTKGVPCDDPITVELIKHGYHTEENIRKFKLNRRFEPWATQNGFIINDTNAICKYTTAVFSFKAAGSFSLIVVMMCNNADPEPWLLDTFMMFLVRVAYYSMRDYADGTPSGSAFNVFARDILDGSLADEDEIEERRRYLGIPANGPFCVFSIDLAESRRLAARIVTDVAHAVAPAKTMLLGGEVVVLCFSCNGVDCPIGMPLAGCPSEVAKVSQRLEEVLGKAGLFAGASSRFDRLSFLPTAHEQAHLALSTGRALVRERDGEGDLEKTGKGGSVAQEDGSAALPRIFRFDDCYFSYMVEAVTRGSRELLTSTRGCRQLLRIRAYDEKHGTDNLRFLRAYLRWERRVTVVADKLHMHRNNVKYRVDRLHELFQLDTDSCEERMELALAYRILDAIDR